MVVAMKVRFIKKKKTHSKRVQSNTIKPTALFKFQRKNKGKYLKLH